MAQPQVLTISWGGPGTDVQVTGPILDKMLSYALLEMARDVIKDFKPSQIVTPPLDFRIPS
jgi:hypothetical protein